MSYNRAQLWYLVQHRTVVDSVPLILQRVVILRCLLEWRILLQTLSGVNYHEFLALCSKYDIDVFSVSENIIKKAVWNVFAQTVDI